MKKRIKSRHSDSSENGNWIFQAGIIFILCSSVILFGAVQQVVFWAEQILIFFLFFLFVIIKIYKNTHIETTPLFFPFMLFLATMLLQLIPLPLAIIELISPQTVTLRQTIGCVKGVSPLSFTPSHTFEQFLRWTGIFLIYLLCANTFTKRTVQRLLNALFALSCFEAFYGLFLLFTGSNWLLWYSKPEYGRFGNRLHGTYRNPDHMAGFLEMVIPLHLAQIFSKRLPTPFKSEEKSRKFLGIFFVVIFVTALFLTISRAGIIAFLAGMIYFYFRGKKSREQTKYNFYLKILVALVMLYLFWIGIGPIIARFFSSMSSLQHGRSIVWRDTLNLIKDFPVFGTGYGSFQFIYPKYRTLLSQSVYLSPHNDYLMVFAEGGIIGLIAFLWLVLSALKLMVSGDSFLARGAAASFISILVHSFFDFNLQIPANAWLFATIMAVSWISREDRHDRHALSHAARNR